MDKIINNLQEPSWWFTGIFFVLVGIILSRLVLRWLPALFASLSKKSSGYFRRFLRGQKLNRKKKIKSIRHDDMLIIKEIIKYYAFMCLFFLSVLILLASIGATANLGVEKEISGESKTRFILMMVLSIPTYVFEIVFIYQRKLVSILIASRKMKRDRAKP